MSAITDFFLKQGKDHRGRTLKQMLAFTDSMIESGHDHIQWLFPLHERSYHSTTAPVLTEDDIRVLASSPEAKFNMLGVLERFRKFLGLNNDTRKISSWCCDRNHNLLRITRAIRSLRLFGLEKEAKILYEDVVYASLGKGITGTTLGYWKRACQNPATESLTEEFLKQKQIKL